MFYATAERRLSTEVGPVRLESVQARLAQCIYLLGSSRINQAWYIFGTATQMILALGLHRSRYSQSFGALTAAGSVEFDCRRRVFWSAYTLDRYLSVILGRPRIIRDEDVDQALPSSLSDTDLAKTGVSARSGQSQRVADGPIFHAKYVNFFANLIIIESYTKAICTEHFNRLAKIIGGISSDLYPTSGIAGANWMVAAERWTAELKAWRESLPAFLNSDKVDPAMLIPIFQRQSTVLKLAYAHALILANRQSLLSNFAELSRRQNPPPRDIAGSLKECIDAAVLVVDTVNNFIEERRMSKAFWFTHYISFCAIATLYVYTIQRSLFSASANVRGSSDLMDETHLQHFQAAEKCQRGIVETTAKNSPFRRYNIILGELQREVLLCLKKKQTSPSEASESVSGARNIGRTSQAGLLAEFPSEIPDEIQNTRGAYSLDFRTTGVSLNAQGVEVQQPQIYDQGYPPQDVGASPTGQIQVFDNIVLDMGLFGSQGEFVGWSEFDAYVRIYPRN
jgi:hypothetical protein